MKRTRERVKLAESRHSVRIKNKSPKFLIGITQPFSQGGKGIASWRKAICLNAYRSDHAGRQAVEVVQTFPFPLIVEIVSAE